MRRKRTWKKRMRKKKYKRRKKTDQGFVKMDLHVTASQYVRFGGQLQKEVVTHTSFSSSTCVMVCFLQFVITSSQFFTYTFCANFHSTANIFHLRVCKFLLCSIFYLLPYFCHSFPFHTNTFFIRHFSQETFLLLFTLIIFIANIYLDLDQIKIMIYFSYCCIKIYSQIAFPFFLLFVCQNLVVGD